LIAFDGVGVALKSAAKSGFDALLRLEGARARPMRPVAYDVGGADRGMWFGDPSVEVEDPRVVERFTRSEVFDAWCFLVLDGIADGRLPWIAEQSIVHATDESFLSIPLHLPWSVEALRSARLNDESLSAALDEPASLADRAFGGEARAQHGLRALALVRRDVEIYRVARALQRGSVEVAAIHRRQAAALQR
jgi:hypothetical protein